MISDKDVTSEVDFDNSDDECLPITQCVCGHKFDVWDFNISIYRDSATPCPFCNRKFYFRNRVSVYQVEE